MIAFELNCLKIIERAPNISIEHSTSSLSKYADSRLFNMHAHPLKKNVKSQNMGTMYLFHVISLNHLDDEAFARRACVCVLLCVSVE